MMERLRSDAPARGEIREMHMRPNTRNRNYLTPRGMALAAAIHPRLQKIAWSDDAFEP